MGARYAGVCAGESSWSKADHHEALHKSWQQASSLWSLVSSQLQHPQHHSSAGHSTILYKRRKILGTQKNTRFKNTLMVYVVSGNKLNSGLSQSCCFQHSICLNTIMMGEKASWFTAHIACFGNFRHGAARQFASNNLPAQQQKAQQHNAIAACVHVHHCDQPAGVAQAP